MRTGKVMHREYHPRFPDGRTPTTLLTKFPIFDSDGQPTAVGSMATDITERKEAEKRLRESEERLWQTTKLARIGYYVWDAVEDRCLFCSDEHARLHGLSPDAFIARAASSERDDSFTHPDDLDEYWRAMKDLRSGKPIEIEYRTVTASGEIYHVREIAEPVFDEAGRVVREIGASQDVTDIHHAEERLRQAQKMEAVGQLTGGVAHDFNNLLAVIIGNAETVEEQLGGGDKSAQAIIRAADRGAELTQRLLAFSRRQPLHSEEIDLEQLTHGMGHLLRRSLGETIEVEISSASGLWNALADHGQVENALLNLAINARDSMPDGGKFIIAAANETLDKSHMATQWELSPGEYVVLSVSDTGIGMTPEVLDHVFEPFYTTKEVGEGSGLGLSMVYGFAKQSGGGAVIHSEPGHGTTVKIFLPRGGEVTHRAAPEKVAVAPLGHGETVLLVEDDPDVRTLTDADQPRLPCPGSQRRLGEHQGPGGGGAGRYDAFGRRAARGHERPRSGGKGQIDRPRDQDPVHVRLYGKSIPPTETPPRGCRLAKQTVPKVRTRKTGAAGADPATHRQPGTALLNTAELNGAAIQSRLPEVLNCKLDQGHEWDAD